MGTVGDLRDLLGVDAPPPGPLVVRAPPSAPIREALLSSILPSSTPRVPILLSHPHRGQPPPLPTTLHHDVLMTPTHVSVIIRVRPFFSTPHAPDAPITLDDCPVMVRGDPHGVQWLEVDVRMSETTFGRARVLFSLDDDSRRVIVPDHDDLVTQGRVRRLSEQSVEVVLSLGRRRA